MNNSMVIYKALRVFLADSICNSVDRKRKRFRRFRRHLHR